MKTRKTVSIFFILFKFSCAIVIASLATSAFAEYYLVYSAPCVQCEGYQFKRIKKYHHVAYKHKKKKAHTACPPPKRTSYYHKPSPQGRWIPAYWENGYWIPAHQIKRTSVRSYHHIYRDRNDYNLDLTTGDDNPYRYPGMNIDN